MKLKDNVSADYENQSSYNVQVRATVGSNYYDETFTVSVKNQDEAPTNISLSGYTIAENVTGAIIGNLSGVDIDSSSLTFSITGGDDSTSFEINGSNQLKLLDSIVTDFETKPSYNVEITVTDSNSNTYAKTFLY